MLAFRRLIRRSGGPVLAALLAVACGSVQQIPGSNVPSPQPPAPSGAFHDWLIGEPRVGEGRSGFHLLASGHDAFRWRVEAARRADQRLYVQSYIWKDDTAGRLLLAELLSAADRGVKVRLLLDDMDVRGDDYLLDVVDSHPRVEVRVFNPFRTRSGLLRAGVELIFRGSALNHRMHNKAWVVDGHFAIVGGRNVGDEYFYAGDAFNFSDLDLAIAGPLALEVDHSFLEYWNSPLAVPLRRMERFDRNPARLADRRASFAEWLLEQPVPELLTSAIGRGEADAVVTSATYVWTADAELVVDDPVGALHGEEPGHSVVEALVERYAGVHEELLLISPYFIPGQGGTELLAGLASRGVRVGVLTNSLAATDVAFAHSGYARRRHALLQGGVELYELRPTAWSHAYRDEGGLGLGASRASLHSKAQILDRREVFVGSFNLGPRSANINTELGVFVSDPRLVEEVYTLYRASIDPALSYRVERDSNGRLRWYGDGETVYTSEPKAGLWRRFVAGLARLLPVESQL